VGLNRKVVRRHDVKKKCESSLTAATSTVYHSSLSILGPCHLCVCQPAPHHQQLLERADYAGRFLAIGGPTNGTTLAYACNTRGLPGPILAAPLRSRSIPTVALFLLTICCVRIIDKDGDTDITDLQPSSVAGQIKLCRRLVRERSSRDSQSLMLFSYGHRTLKTRLPVRSALVKQCIARLVLWWVTTWESLVL
jgi:hypothetical protein